MVNRVAGWLIMTRRRSGEAQRLRWQCSKNVGDAAFGPDDDARRQVLEAGRGQEHGRKGSQGVKRDDDTKTLFGLSRSRSKAPSELSPSLGSQIPLCRVMMLRVYDLEIATQPIDPFNSPP